MQPNSNLPCFITFTLLLHYLLLWFSSLTEHLEQAICSLTELKCYITHRQRCFTLNSTFPSLTVTGPSSWPVISVQLVFHGLPSESRYTLMTSFESFEKSCLLLRRVRGTLIVTGSICTMFWELEMWMTGPQSIPMSSNSLLGNSCTLNEKIRIVVDF